MNNMIIRNDASCIRLFALSGLKTDDRRTKQSSIIKFKISYLAFGSLLETKRKYMMNNTN